MLAPLPPSEAPAPERSRRRWAKLIDHDSCIGCHACTTACKSENEVPLGVTRTFVKYVETGAFPEAKRRYQVTRCNQCADAPCVAACPTSAMHARPDGIVDFDKSICIGCKACIAACPYDAIFINPEDHAAEKCNFCAHRIDQGLEPACVVVCPTQAILVGDLDDPTSRVSRIVHREPVQVRRPEKDTQPKLFYRGATQSTLDPLAARRPGGGLFLWSEQRAGGQHVVGGHPAEASRTGSNSSAAALLAYDVPHRAPWDWKVSLYTVTKAIAAGAYLAPLLLLALGAIEVTSPLWAWGAPATALAFLAVTGLLLIADLTRPARFWMIFLRPQWRSWLVRGAFLITGFGLALAAHLFAAWAGRTDLLLPIAFAGAPLALATAVYTAFLFAQAKARDLWQSALLPVHMTVQTVLAGAAASLPLALATGAGPAVLSLQWILFSSSLLHLLLVLGEAAQPHVTAHARLASWEMTTGRFKKYFQLGGVGSAVALLAPWSSALAPAFPVVVALTALLGLLAYEHAYVQAGQSVPLA
jgi:Fe-S-cluster-containing dehydrogenase component/formate-dependent nitrite reductase membrane component NrfD